MRKKIVVYIEWKLRMRLNKNKMLKTMKNINNVKQCEMKEVRKYEITLISYWL